jgi:hypothetical protein
MEVNEGNSSNKVYYEERVLKSCLDQLASLLLETM